MDTNPPTNNQAIKQTNITRLFYSNLNNLLVLLSDYPTTNG